MLFPPGAACAGRRVCPTLARVDLAPPAPTAVVAFGEVDLSVRAPAARTSGSSEAGEADVTAGEEEAELEADVTTGACSEAGAAAGAGAGTATGGASATESTGEGSGSGAGGADAGGAAGAGGGLRAARGGSSDSGST